MSATRTRLIMLASDLKVLKKVPKGTFDKHGDNVPERVWKSTAFARRWLLAGGELPVKEPKAKRAPAPQRERGLSKRKLAELDRHAKGAALDWLGDQLSDGRDPDDLLEEGSSVAPDLADGVLFGEGIEKPFPPGLRGSIADTIYSTIIEALEDK